MSNRVEPPDYARAETSPLLAPDLPAPAANEAGAAADTRHALKTADGLTSVTAAAWRISVPPARANVVELGRIRRGGPRGPRR